MINLKYKTFEYFKFVALGLFGICYLYFGALASFAATSVDTSKIAVGARSLAMGRVSAASPGDLNALFINPANAATLPNWGVTSLYTSLLEGDITYTSLGGAKNEILGGTLGLAYLGGSSSGLFVTSIDANSRVVPTGTTFDYANSTITLVYGKTYRPDLAVGGSFKLLSKSFGSQGSSSGYAIDLGLLYNWRENINLGLTAQNLISGLSWPSGSEGLPLGIKGGLSYNLKPDLLIAADTDLTPFSLHAGVEWKPMPLLAVRGGLESLPTGASSVINMTMGVGLAFKEIIFDYAYFNDGAMAANSTHYFSISYLPKEKASVNKIQATPPTVAPTAKPALKTAPPTQLPVEKKVSPKKKKEPAAKAKGAKF